MHPFNFRHIGEGNDQLVVVEFAGDYVNPEIPLLDGITQFARLRFAGFDGPDVGVKETRFAQARMQFQIPMANQLLNGRLHHSGRLLIGRHNQKVSNSSFGIPDGPLDDDSVRRRFQNVVEEVSLLLGLQGNSLALANVFDRDDRPIAEFSGRNVVPDVRSVVVTVVELRVVRLARFGYRTKRLKRPGFPCLRIQRQVSVAEQVFKGIAKLLGRHPVGVRITKVGNNAVGIPDGLQHRDGILRSLQNATQQFGQV